MRANYFLIRLIAPLCCAAALFLLGPSASAGGFMPCEMPFVFSGAAANIVPIEFLATASDARNSDSASFQKLQRTAQHLAWLVELDSWHQPTYGSLGVVAHLFLRQICAPDEILSGIIEGRGGGRVKPEQVLLVLQGRIFIEGEQVLVQSRLRGFRRNDVGYHAGNDLTLFMQPETVAASLEGGRALRARLPALDITFAPRVMTEGELAEIDKRFEQASRLHSKRSVDSRSEPLRFEPGNPQAFSVEILDGGSWLRIKEFFSGRTGFIRTDPAASDFLHTRLPELDFLNGALGYLRLVQAQRRGHEYPPPPRNAGIQARTSLRHFLERQQTADEPETRALARALLGVIALQAQVGGGTRPDGTGMPADWHGARAEFREAVRLAPYSSTHRNLLGLADARLCCAGLLAGEFGDPAVDFTDSLSLDPRNVDALKNLNVFLAVLGGLEARGVPPAGVDTSRLAERRKVVEHVLVGIAN